VLQNLRINSISNFKKQNHKIWYFQFFTSRSTLFQRRLREQLAESQSELERAMTEHGMILAEMQQQYGREKRRSENLENQVLF